MLKQSLLYTEEPKFALHIRGYQFNPAPYGFSFGPKNRTAAYKVSVFGSVFMNDLMVRSGLSGAASFRYMFGNKRYEYGDLASCSPSVAEEILRNGKSYEEADNKVLELFLSDDLSAAGAKMPCLYEVPLVNACTVTETYEEDGENKLKVKDDDKPFYYIINMIPPHQSEVATHQLPDEWKAMLARRQYSYYFDAGSNRIAVSNTKSAYFGLPPNSKALGMPLLKTQIIPENCKSPAVGKKQSLKRGAKKEQPKKETPKKEKPSKEKKTSGAKQAVSTNPVAWQDLLKAFFNSPSEVTYKELVLCGSAWKEFYATDKDEALKLSKYAAKRMRKPYVGIANAVEGLALIEVIGSKWADEKSRLIVLLKWATLTRWEQGKVYFKEEDVKDAKAAGQETEPAKAEQPEAEEVN